MFDTRWLVREKVMSKILANWYELKVYLIVQLMLVKMMRVWRFDFYEICLRMIWTDVHSISQFLSVNNSVGSSNRLWLKIQTSAGYISGKNPGNRRGVEDARNRCKDMLKEFKDQVSQKLPMMINSISDVGSLKPSSPGIILSHTKMKNIDQLPHQHMINDAIEDQYRRVVCHD